MTGLVKFEVAVTGAVPQRPAIRAIRVRFHSQRKYINLAKSEWLVVEKRMVDLCRKVQNVDRVEQKIDACSKRLWARSVISQQRSMASPLPAQIYLRPENIPLRHDHRDDTRSHPAFDHDCDEVLSAPKLLPLPPSLPLSAVDGSFSRVDQKLSFGDVVGTGYTFWLQMEIYEIWFSSSLPFY